MLIQIFGLDKHVVGAFSQSIHLPLVKLTNCDESNLFFSCQEGFLFHQGVDQNAWHTAIHIFLEPNLKDLQPKIQQLFMVHLKDDTIHFHFKFFYIDAANQAHFIHKDYPLFVTESNAVRIEPTAEHEEEIYLGNAFEGKEEQLDQVEKKLKKKSN